MSNFNDWWEGLSLSLKMYWGLAIPFTLFFILQLIWSFFGGGDVPDDTPDAEIEADSGVPFQFFTLKNLVAFFTIFSWTGIACIDSGISETVSLAIAILSGLAMMTIMASIFYFLGKANADGTMKIKKAIGGIGEVYLTMQKKRGSVGKVQIKVQGALRTLEAITDDNEDIPTGKMITVKGVINNSILLVTAN
ncbi:MAG: hypothetical protein JNM57_04215 [Cyclobacteriaceae bacterium]|nr:hypothetical protein [Cyclobacteriaceae bacterium]